VTHKERILTACRGEVPDRLPWVPRMDLWYKARANVTQVSGGLNGWETGDDSSLGRVDMGAS